MKRNNKIVVVDDDPDYCYLVKEALQICDPTCTLEAVRSGSELLIWLATHDRPSLIFLDINMPGPNGFDTLRALKATEQYKYIPVVMLTTSEQVDDVHTSYEIGANAYITKPMTFTDLLPRLNLFSRYWLDHYPPSMHSWPEHMGDFALN
ncbi:response regulator [Spirosoma aerophilum]